AVGSTEADKDAAAASALSRVAHPMEHRAEDVSHTHLPAGAELHVKGRHASFHQTPLFRVQESDLGTLSHHDRDGDAALPSSGLLRRGSQDEKEMRGGGGGEDGYEGAGGAGLGTRMEVARAAL